MSYPGNPSLPAAVKDRVLTTFQQTLALFKQGRADEVAAGCNLLLQMDPMFDPAKKLLAKLRNPALPLDLDSLLPSNDQQSPMEQARTAMAARDFERVIQLTTDVLTDDLLNDEARILGDEAREKIEAAPFVEQFTRKAEQSLTGGNVASAKMELEKARALDPTHPDVVRIARAIEARSAAPAQSAPPPSFVVDAPTAAPGGRAASPAADFGFTFEEEKPAEVSFANFSFDTPAASDFSFDKTTPQPPAAAKPTDTSPFGGFSFDAKPTAQPGAAEFDFATASVVANEDDQKKIDQYLVDGDRAFEAGDYSQAIDLWSRIFLIDVTNDQASDRIERAKMKRREIEQKVETMLASGIEAFERGDTAKAHAELTEVLRLDPRNTSAQEHLDRLGETVAGREPSKPTNAYVAPPPDEKYGGDLFDDDELSMGGYETPLIPPDPATATAGAAATAAKAKTKAAPAPSARKLPLGLIAIVLGVLVLAAGGWFAWSRMSTDDVETAGEGETIIARASMLAKNGRYDQAIALLSDIKPGDPKHNDALVMIDDLKKKKSTSAALIDGIPAAEYYEQRVAAATAAFAAGDYLASKAAFEQALRVKALPPNLKAQYDAAVQQASKLDAAKTLFSERRYSEAIANLQPLLEAEPQNASIRRMVADAHFNLGAMALQEERIDDAVREMDEVLKMDPNDELARRSRELAVRYKGETKDLLYKIYVKYLPLRAGT